MFGSFIASTRRYCNFRSLICMAGVFVVVGCAAMNTSDAEAPLRYTGINIAGGEFAPEKLPGVYARDYIYPDSQSLAYFANTGMNTIRVPVLWERVQHQLSGELDAAEIDRLDAVINDAVSKGLRVIIDVHNYAAYRGAMLGTAGVPTKALGDLWRRISGRYGDNDAVIFGLMNEPNNLKTETWLEAANFAVAGIREAGAKNLILVPGNGWSSARSWVDSDYGTPNGEVMLNIEDPANNFAYEVHQYFNSDFTGTTADCQSIDIGIATLTPFTQWARKHHQRGLLGEIGVGAGSTCLEALDKVLSFMAENNDVWIGWTYWAGGAWWPSDYFTSVQPLNGKDKPQMTVLRKYTRGAPADIGER
jgi:endoglucanase